MTGSRAIRQWARLHPLGKLIALVLGLGAVLSGCLAIYVLLHHRLSPHRAHLAILVLPFINPSGNPDQDYVADAITDTVTLDISQIKDSFVIGRGTAFSYKGKPVDVKSLTRDLDVRYVLRGTAARDGDKIHVTTQLVDGATGATLSAEKFDGDLAEAGEICQEAASRVPVDLNFQGPAITVKRSPSKTNPEAVDLTLRGQAYLDQGTSKDTLLAAQRSFTQALALAPDDETALAGRGRVTAELVDRYPDAASAQNRRAAELDLAQALRINPQDPIALSAASGIEASQGGLEKALIDNQQAIDVDPNFPEALAAQGGLLILSGKSAQAVKMIDRALKLSPSDPALADFLSLKCSALIRFHEYSQAVTFCAKSVALAPTWFTVSSLVASYMIIGDLDHVKRTKDLLLRIKSDFTIHECLRILDARSANPEYRSGSERFAFYLKQAGLPE